MSQDERPDDVGANTGRFEAFVKRGEELERDRPPRAAFRIVTLLAGLAVLAVVIALLLR